MFLLKIYFYINITAPVLKKCTDFSWIVSIFTLGIGDESDLRVMEEKGILTRANNTRYLSSLEHRVNFYINYKYTGF